MTDRPAGQASVTVMRTWAAAVIRRNESVARELMARLASEGIVPRMCVARARACGPTILQFVLRSIGTVAGAGVAPTLLRALPTCRCKRFLRQPQDAPPDRHACPLIRLIGGQGKSGVSPMNGTHGVAVWRLRCLPIRPYRAATGVDIIEVMCPVSNARPISGPCPVPLILINAVFLARPRPRQTMPAPAPRVPPPPHPLRG
jgi:hypothetical protein